jgi:hypothetical protein
VSLLLAQPGIRTNIKNKEGQLPLDLSKNDDVGALLVNFMGESGAEALLDAEEEQ